MGRKKGARGHGSGRPTENSVGLTEEDENMNETNDTHEPAAVDVDGDGVQEDEAELNRSASAASSIEVDISTQNSTNPFDEDDSRASTRDSGEDEALGASPVWQPRPIGDEMDVGLGAMESGDRGGLNWAGNEGERSGSVNSASPAPVGGKGKERADASQRAPAVHVGEMHAPGADMDSRPGERVWKRDEARSGAGLIPPSPAPPSRAPLPEMDSDGLAPGTGVRSMPAFYWGVAPFRVDVTDGEVASIVNERGKEEEHVEYLVHVIYASGTKEMVLRRRFSRFISLRDALKREVPMAVPRSPPKDVWTRFMGFLGVLQVDSKYRRGTDMSKEFISKRRAALDEWMKQLLCLWPLVCSNALLAFLGLRGDEVFGDMAGYKANHLYSGPGQNYSSTMAVSEGSAAGPSSPSTSSPAKVFNSLSDFEAGRESPDRAVQSRSFNSKGEPAIQTNGLALGQFGNPALGLLFREVGRMGDARLAFSDSLYIDSPSSGLSSPIVITTSEDLNPLTQIESRLGFLTRPFERMVLPSQSAETVGADGQGAGEHGAPGRDTASGSNATDDHLLAMMNRGTPQKGKAPADAPGISQEQGEVDIDLNVSSTSRNQRNFASTQDVQNVHSTTAGQNLYATGAIMVWSWNNEGNLVLVALHEAESGINCACWIPGRNWLVTGARNGSVRVWSLHPSQGKRGDQIVLELVGEVLPEANDIFGNRTNPAIAFDTGHGTAGLFYVAAVDCIFVMTRNGRLFACHLGASSPGNKGPGASPETSKRHFWSKVVLFRLPDKGKVTGLSFYEALSAAREVASTSGASGNTEEPCIPLGRLFVTSISGAVVGYALMARRVVAGEDIAVNLGRHDLVKKGFMIVHPTAGSPASLAPAAPAAVVHDARASGNLLLEVHLASQVAHEDGAASPSWDAVAGKYLVTSSCKQPCMRLWNVERGNACQLAAYLDHVHRDPVTACVYLGRQRKIVSCDASGCLAVWDATTGTPICFFRAHADGITSCKFIPDNGGTVGGILLTTGKDMYTSLWRVTFPPPSSLSDS